MKIAIENNELIGSFLNGTLSRQETGEVLSRIKADPQFAQEVDSVRELQKVITESALLDVKDKLTGIHHSRIQRNNRLKWGGGIGLSVLLVLFLLYQFYPARNNNFIVQPAHQLDSTNIKHKTSEVKLAPALNQTIEKAMPTVVANKAEDKYIIQTFYSEQNSESRKQPTDTLNRSVEFNDTLRTKVENKKYYIAVSGNNGPAYRVVFCGKVKIEAEYTSMQSCAQKPTGSISITDGTVRGGALPYKYSLNRKDFSDSSTFRNLYPGIYPVYIKDADNCIKQVGRAIIEQTDCLPQYADAFAPLQGEVWNIPAKGNATGNIRIVSKKGALVYSAQINAADANTWNGRTNSGNDLPMGVYQFTIVYSDKEVFTGTVTIIK